jgi:IclR family KDG regulon transcriptional repressor
MKSLQKALDILELFWKHHEELSLSEMAALSHHNKTTIFRVVSTLLQRGYLKQEKKRGKYSLGNVFLEFSGIVKGNVEIRDLAIPYLVELSRFVKESVLIAIWDGKNSVFTETFHETGYSSGILKVIPEEGTSIPLYCTCVGKIILAYMSEEECAKYFKSITLEKRTPNSIIDLSILKTQFPEIRSENIAYDDEEYVHGVRGVASGIRDRHNNIVGAICIIGPSVRLSKDILKNMGPTVRSFAVRISKALGYWGKEPWKKS